ncbi:MAE_28990/MAE_18760 family HEPN-like nuclease [uncultured Psychromonas sp.]|uniref:MAE_28990/MAE_18760 family HEPN-like nuclease n=1 Tax=uncultured Psychromonas sp. TaxID=173974 RepID=UPI00261BC5F0|nr:MAE_28990/MAE_18760 family HEPN-like nuclease [uncultured Psychromonas sp.]
MDNIKRELAIREQEIKSYVKFLTQLDITNSAIVSSLDDLLLTPSIRPKEENLVPDDIKKILKANLCLMLYNVTEGFIKQSILNVLDTINNTHTYSKLTDNMKIIWLERCVVWFEYKSDDFKSSGMSKKLFYAKLIDRLGDDLLSFITEEEKSDPRKFSERFGIPGNVDHTTFKKLADEYGIVLSDRSVFDKEDTLKTLREDRNKLAHGNISFNDFGHTLSVAELVELSNDVFEYLGKIANMFQTYLREEKYLNEATC